MHPENRVHDFLLSWAKVQTIARRFFKKQTIGGVFWGVSIGLNKIKWVLERKKEWKSSLVGLFPRCWKVSEWARILQLWTWIMTKKQPCRISPTGLLLFSHFNLRPIPKQKHQTPIMEHGEIFQNGIPDRFVKRLQHRICLFQGL